MIIQAITALIGGAFCIYVGYCAGKTTGFEKGLKAGREDIIASVNDLHFWFSSKPEIMNTLFLVQERLKRNWSLGAASLRETVSKYGNKRYCDLNEEEFKEFNA